VIADVRRWGGGLGVAQQLAQANIITNKNLIPGDGPADWDRPSGLRLGTTELTRLGLGEAEMATVAEFMARVPVEFKIRRGRLRYLERQLGERYLPPEVLQRKKQGFASPLMYIMGTEVRRLAPRLLRGSELVRDGYLRAERVDTLVQEHLEGRRDHGNRIWLLLTSELWYRHYISRESVADLELELTERDRGVERLATPSLS